MYGLSDPTDTKVNCWMMSGSRAAHFYMWLVVFSVYVCGWKKLELFRRQKLVKMWFLKVKNYAGGIQLYGLCCSERFWPRSFRWWFWAQFKSLLCLTFAISYTMQIQNLCYWESRNNHAVLNMTPYLELRTSLKKFLRNHHIQINYADAVLLHRWVAAGKKRQVT